MQTNNNEKRIAMFSLHSDPLAAIGSRLAGGQNVYVKSLAQSLDKKGWSIDIFTRLDDLKKKRVSSFGKRSCVIRLSAGKPVYTPKGNLHPYFEEFYQNFLRYINFKNPYQLFHGHHYDGGQIALMAHNQFKKPLIINFHSLGRVRFETQKKYSFDGNDKKIFEERFLMEKEIAEKASVIISLAETEKRDLKLLYGIPLEKIKIIPGGVDVKNFAPIMKEKAREILNLLKEDFILLFVGRMEWRKGVGTLINAIKLLKDKIPNIKALIVGGKIFGLRKNKDDFKEYQRLLELAKSQNIQESIKFVGRVDHGRLPLYYSAGNILVIPSYYEPFGLVALEGMASKIPVIASRKGGLRFTIKDKQNGLLFETRNPLDLSEKIMEIFQSKTLAENLIKNAYEDIVKNYSWADISEKISDIYKKISNNIGGMHENSAIGPIRRICSS